MNYYYWKRLFSRIAFTIVGLSGTFVPACSFVVKQEFAQCRTDLDCLKNYPGTQCIQGGCAPRNGKSLLLDADPPSGETVCSSTQECLADKAPYYICQSSKCVKLAPSAEEGCNIVLGDYKKDNTLFLGALIPSKELHPSIHDAMKNALQLAVNDFGYGLPRKQEEDTRRPVAVVVCNENENPALAVDHLLTQVKVQAILGPSFQSSLTRINRKLLDSPSKPFLLSLAPVEEPNPKINRDFLWSISPSNAKIAASIAKLIKEVVGPKLKKEDPLLSQLRVTLLYKSDDFGNSIQHELKDNYLKADLTFNDIDYGNSDELKPEPRETAFNAAVSTVTKPDTSPNIIVLAGHTEGVTDVLKRIEDNWPQQRKRPFYILSPGMLIPELLARFEANNDANKLRARTLIVSPGLDSNNDTSREFKVAYKNGFPETQLAAPMFGTAAIYDAMYLMMYAIGSRNVPNENINPSNIFVGFLSVTAADAENQQFNVGPGNSDTIRKVYNHIFRDQLPINLNGASGLLDFDSHHNATSDIQIWCAFSNGASMTFESAGMSFDGNQLKGNSIAPNCSQ